MTNEVIEVITNGVTRVYTLPQQVAWDYKQWAGVVGSIAASLYTAFHVAFPIVQRFCDSRDGGWLQWAFYAMFGQPKAAQPTIKP